LQRSFLSLSLTVSFSLILSSETPLLAAFSLLSEDASSLLFSQPVLCRGLLCTADRGCERLHVVEYSLSSPSTFSRLLVVSSSLFLTVVAGFLSASAFQLYIEKAKEVLFQAEL